MMASGDHCLCILYHRQCAPFNGPAINVFGSGKVICAVNHEIDWDMQRTSSASPSLKMTCKLTPDLGGFCSG